MIACCAILIIRERTWEQWGYSILAQPIAPTKMYFASKIQRNPRVCICFFIVSSSGCNSSFHLKLYQCGRYLNFCRPSLSPLVGMSCIKYQVCLRFPIWFPLTSIYLNVSVKGLLSWPSQRFPGSDWADYTSLDPLQHPHFCKPLFFFLWIIQWKFWHLVLTDCRPLLGQDFY